MNKLENVSTDELVNIFNGKISGESAAYFNLITGSFHSRLKKDINNKLYNCNIMDGEIENRVSMMNIARAVTSITEPSTEIKNYIGPDWKSISETARNEFENAVSNKDVNLYLGGKLSDWFNDTQKDENTITYNITVGNTLQGVFDSNTDVTVSILRAISGSILDSAFYNSKEKKWTLNLDLDDNSYARLKPQFEKAYETYRNKTSELDRISLMNNIEVNDYCQGKYGYYFEWNDESKSCEVYSNESGDFVGFVEAGEFNYTDDLSRTDGKEGTNRIPDEYLDYVIACARVFDKSEREMARYHLFENKNGSRILCRDNDDGSVSVNLYDNGGSGNNYVLTEVIPEKDILPYRNGQSDKDVIALFIERISDAYELEDEFFGSDYDEDFNYKLKLYKDAEKYGFGKVMLRDKNSGEYLEIERVDGTNSFEYYHYGTDKEKIIDHDTFNCDTTFETAVDAIWKAECLMPVPDFEIMETEYSEGEISLDNFNRLKDIFDKVQSVKGSGSAQTFEEMYEFVKSEYPDEKADFHLLNTATRMIEGCADFNGHEEEDYLADESISETVAKALVDGKINDFKGILDAVSEGVKKYGVSNELSWDELSVKFKDWYGYGSSTFEDMKNDVSEENPGRYDYDLKCETVARYLENNLDDYGLNELRDNINVRLTNVKDTEKNISDFGNTNMSQSELSTLQSVIADLRWKCFDNISENIVQGTISPENAQKAFSEQLKNDDFFAKLISNGFIAAPDFITTGSTEVYQIISTDEIKLLEKLEKEVKSVPDFFVEHNINFRSEESLKTYAEIKKQFTEIFDRNAPFIFGEHMDKFVFRDYCDVDQIVSGLSPELLESDLGRMLNTDGVYFENEKWDFQCNLTNLIFTEKVEGWKKELENVIVPDSSSLATRGLNYTTYRTKLKDNSLIFKMNRPLDGEKGDECFILTEIRNDGNRKVSYEQLRTNPNNIITKVRGYELEYNMMPELRDVIKTNVENDINKLKKTHMLENTLNAMHSCMVWNKPYDFDAFKNDFSHVCQDFMKKTNKSADSIAALNYIYKKLPEDFKNNVKKIIADNGVSRAAGDKKLKAFLDSLNPTINTKKLAKAKGREGR